MNKRTKLGLLFLAVGTLLVLCATGIHLAHEREDELAGESAALLLQTLDDKTRLPEGTAGTDPLLPTVLYRDRSILAAVSVPSLGLRLPVFNEWDEELLKTAPCRYRGSLSENNLILMGHNYKSHFGPLSDVRIGETVTLENTLGNKFHFTVDKIEALSGSDGELLPDETYPLTLFTCDMSGTARIVVRCIRTQA